MLLSSVPISIALVSVLAGLSADPMGGPFRIVPERLEECPRELYDFREFPLFLRLRGIRDRTNVDRWYYTVNTTTAFNFSDDIDLRLNAATWSTRGGWKDNFHVLKFKRMCSTIKSLIPTMWNNVMIGLFGKPRDCPIPPGSYYGSNITLDLKVNAVPSFFYGKYRVDCIGTEVKTDKRVGCLRAYVQVVPRN